MNTATPMFTWFFETVAKQPCKQKTVLERSDLVLKNENNKFYRVI